MKILFVSSEVTPFAKQVALVMQYLRLQRHFLEQAMMFVYSSHDIILFRKLPYKTRWGSRT